MTQPAAGVRVARHAALSVLGFILPLAIAVVALPIAARGLGPARFGLLGLAWATVEYLGFFDLGLGRSTVRFVSEALARASTDLRQIVVISVASQLAMALVAGGLVALVAPLLVTRVFTVPPELHAEATGMFRLAAANVVVVMAMGSLRAVLEGARRFDLSTALKIPAAAAAIVIPAVGAYMGGSLPQIMAGIVLARLLLCAMLAATVPRAIAGFKWEPPREWIRLRSLLSYSGWVAVTSVLTPVLVSGDRFLLGSLVGVTAVGFYVAPYEGAARLLLVPASMFAALFPALSATEAVGDRGESMRLLGSALRQLALVMIPPALILVLFAPDILDVWLGPAFAAQAGLALRLLAMGVLINALAHVPSVFLYSAGRPDIPAKLHLAEAAFHIPLTVILIGKWGITGAALAWTIRVIVDATMLALFAAQHAGKSWRIASRARTASFWAPIVSLAVLLLLARTLGPGSPVLTASIIGVGLIVFAVIAWTVSLSPQERAGWRRLVALGGPSIAAPETRAVDG